MLGQNELIRYDRQILIKELGEFGQEKLKQSKVFIAGAGGLGCLVSIYLVAAGIGTIRIVDNDKVELSNLNRQVLHWDENIGMNKAYSAVEKLRKLNPSVQIEGIAETIAEINVINLTTGFDIIVDGMDNLPTRYLLNKTAIHLKKPFFHGAVYGFEGRAMTIIPGKTACLQCVYHGGVTPEEKFPVIGVTPAVIACIQATEVIKYLAGIGNLLTDRLLIYDGLNLHFTELNLSKDPNCTHCGYLSL